MQCSGITFWAGLFFYLAVSWLTDLAHAEPYLAVREGYKCSFCHTNLTGGGKRTGVVSAHSDSFLKYPKNLFEALDQRTPITGQVVDGISVGANLRGAFTTLFRDTPNQRGRVRNNRAFRPADSSNFDILEGTAYLEVNLIKDALTFYLDESFAPGSALNRETFGLLTILPIFLTCRTVPLLGSARKPPCKKCSRPNRRGWKLPR